MPDAAGRPATTSSQTFLPGTRMGPIVVVFTGSAAGWRALHYALGRAVRTRCDLVVAVNESVRPPVSEMVDTSAFYVANTDHWARQRREILRVAQDHPDVRVRLAAGHGTSVRTLTSLAQRWNAGELVVGGGRRARRLGTPLPVRFMETSKIPVTVVP